MKTNAMLVAAILFIAGCATDQGGLRQAGHDPASDAYRGGFSGSTAERGGAGDLARADSSIRGGSFEARGMRKRVETEPAPHPMNPLYKADSGIRGGSWMARDREWNAAPPEQPPSHGRDGIKADSSIRGGSFEARGWKPRAQSNAGVGGAARSETGIYYSPDEMPEYDLNTSDKLEENITGRYHLEEREGKARDPNAMERFSGRFDSRRSTDIVHDGVTEVESQYEPFELESQEPAGRPSAFEEGKGETSAVQNQRLAEKVKSRLIRETTGTTALLPKEVARNIRVTARGGVITLKGSVPTEREKQMIEIRTLEVEGVRRVDNQLKVASRSVPESREVEPLGHDLEDRTDDPRN